LKLASFCIPHVGGTYTVARNLRVGLERHGISLRWIGVGATGAKAMSDFAMASERAFGELVAPAEADMALQARALVAHLEERRYDGVLIDVLGGVLQGTIARYLSKNLLRVLIVHSVTPGTYAFARANRDHVHLAVGVSPRVRDDLVQRHGFRPDLTVVIPNPVDVDRFTRLQRSNDAAELRVVYLGRIEDGAKGVFWLPRILRRLNGTSVRMTVAGGGPDLADLEARFRNAGVSSTVTGAIGYDAVPGLLAANDVLLLPSRYEGFGITVIEAMAAGCVPVVSRIRGVTDFVVEHARTGFLFPIGGIGAAARAIVQLDRDRGLLRRVSAACREAVVSRFSLDVVAETYSERIRSVDADRPEIAPPLSLDDWRVPKEMTPRLRSRMPDWLKNFGRTRHDKRAWRARE
jgi:glycosyltransferase involved in cell wall biosynthesis